MSAQDLTAEAFKTRRLEGLGLCFLIASLDMLTTYLLFSSRKGVERGFIVGFLVSHFGLMTLPLYAPVEALIMFLAFKAISLLRIKLKVKKRVEYVFLLVVSYPVVNNIMLLLC
jgi:hypothetical protein